MKTKIPSLALLPTLVGACDHAEPEPEPVSIEDVAQPRDGALPANVKEHHDVYLVRRDQRRCAYPTCGGWFLSEINQASTTCPDGATEAECYVPGLLLPEGIEAEDGNLLHGDFGTADILGATWGTFEADFVYESVLEDPWPYGSHDLVFDTGIVCVTTPCPTTALVHLNHHWGVDPLDFFFWGADAAEDAVLEEAFWTEYGDDASEAGGGAMVFGDFWLIFGDVYYSIYDVYARKVPQLPVCVIEDDGNEVVAWTFASEEAAQPLVAELTGTVTVAEGTCGEQQLYCPAVYEPVHGGIDAHGDVCEEHGNACEFRAAVIAAAGDLKARGSWQAGPC